MLGLSSGLLRFASDWTYFNSDSSCFDSNSVLSNSGRSCFRADSLGFNKLWLCFKSDRSCSIIDFPNFALDFWTFSISPNVSPDFFEIFERPCSEFMLSTLTKPNGAEMNLSNFFFGTDPSFSRLIKSDCVLDRPSSSVAYIFDETTSLGSEVNEGVVKSVSVLSSGE